MMTLLWETSMANKPPRTCFLDFPLGCPAGKPHEPAQQREILRAALNLASEFDPQRWEIKTLPFQWSKDGSRDWEEEVKDLYRNGGLAMVAVHRAAHQKLGESLAGREREFAMKCNC
jgi:D-proline reductase (dithiol) PrdB